MNKLLICFLLLFASISVSAQTIVKGDMDGDGNVTIGDVTRVVATAMGSLPKEEINIIDYSALSGEWVRQSDGDGNYIYYSDGSTGDDLIFYKYIPGNGYQQGLIYFYFSNGQIHKILVVHELTANQLVVSNYEDYNHNYNTFGTKTTYVRKVSVTGISIDQTTITSQVGNTHQLTATLTPLDVTKKYVNWSSSNTDVATVSKSGLVTIAGYGSCNISAHATDGSGLSATCTVSVPRLVESITLDRTSLVLHKDHEYSLNATVSPANADNKNLTWTTDNSTYVTVTSDGTVKAWVCSPAAFTITCTANDGSGVSASCTVYVPQPEYVDLGLPSGTLWATFNVGAATPNEVGEEFRWGETDYYPTGVNNSWSLYKYANGDWNKLTKYCPNPQYGDNGYYDNRTELEFEDDAATVYWGEDWCTPTKEQWQELIDNCTWNLERDGKINYDKGFTVRSNKSGNSNSIFIPASSFYMNSIGLMCPTGYYWSKSISSESEPYKATNLYFIEIDRPALQSSDRYYGRRVRPVRKVTQ